jgi:hypothetical protein
MINEPASTVLQLRKRATNPGKAAFLQQQH